MLRKLIVIISGLLGVTVGTLITNIIFSNNYFSNINDIVLRLVVTSIITLLFIILSLLFSSRLVSVIKKIEEKLSNIPMSKVVFTTIGLILGLLVAALLSLATSSIVSIPLITSIISGLFYLVFGYLGFILGYRRGGEFLGLFTNRLPISRSKNEDKKSNGQSFIYDKVVDTSALIDSRIHDVAQTGFLEGKVIVPEFVLKELQLIADSEDPIKRSKGRLGLDCVEDLQKTESVNLVIDSDYKYKEHDAVDGLLIDYAKKNRCAIITTDYNLNKLATVQSIKVLNVNDLSNAVKPILTAGEKLTVHVQREGKENNQGIAYTEDGTMIVVENGKKSVGKNIEVEVQSVLQTSSGRIIFTKII